jgi:hypothetical protein
VTKSFSERYGYLPPKLAQVEAMDRALRNGLLDVVQRRLNHELMRWDELGGLHNHSRIARFWAEVEKRTIQSLGREGAHGFSAHLAAAFGERAWNAVYDIVEWFSTVEQSESFDSDVNVALERENAGYRLVDGHITPITGAAEVAEAEAAATGPSSSADHLRRAIERLNASAPDYRNAIKEAVQAVEAEVKLTAVDTKKNKPTLGDALKSLRDKLHPALCKAAEGLYGYAGDDGGIRHAKGEGDRDPTRDEARFCVVVCSALVNLLRAQRVAP